MPQATFVQDGRFIDYTLSGTIAKGDIIISGVRAFVANQAGVSGDVISLDTEGVYDITKKAGDTPGVGALVYWDDTNNEATTTASTHKLLGHATVAALSGDATVRVKLQPMTA